MAQQKHVSTGASTSTAKALGATLDHIGARVAAWRQQHAQIVSEIRLIVDRASKMLAEVGEHVVPSRTSTSAPARTRRGGRPKGYRISEATRAKLRAAWARRKGSDGTPSSAAPARKGRRKRTMSPEARARIAAAQKKRWAAVKKAKATQS